MPILQNPNRNPIILSITVISSQVRAEESIPRCPILGGVRPPGEGRLRPAVSRAHEGEGAAHQGQRRRLHLDLPQPLQEQVRGGEPEAPRRHGQTGLGGGLEYSRRQDLQVNLQSTVQAVLQILQILIEISATCGMIL